MNKTWLITIFTLSFLLLSILKTHEKASLSPFFKADPVLKLKNFSEARGKVVSEELELLKLWESMLTGRAAPLSRLLKERYQSLGLNHLFTPSGFHISAVLIPIFKIVRNQHQQLGLIIFLGIALTFLPGMGALKRMLLIKGHQKVLGQHLGFIFALFIDVLFGSFQHGALSFTYSFLFIGIIYSGLSGAGLIIWFFIAQLTLALFQGNDVSLLLLLFSPLLNLAFSVVMPLLFLLALPLWDWQLHTGIFLLKGLQGVVNLSASITSFFPVIEIHIGILLLIFFILLKKWKLLVCCLLILSFDVNLDRQKTPTLPSKVFLPQGRILKTTYAEKDVRLNFEDGNCKMRLVRGLWWENCSPRRRSNGRKIMKLSYPSRGSRKSSLRG